MKVMNEKNQNFTNYVSQISDTELESDYASQANEAQLISDYESQINNAEVIYDSDYDNFTPDSDYIDSSPTCNITCRPTAPSASTCNLTDSDVATCSLDNGELACGDDFADNGDAIQGGPCQDLMEYFSDKPYLD